MKKNKKIKNKVVYEENPWADDPPGKLVRVKDFLPTPGTLKKAKVRYIKESDDVPLPLRDADIKTLRKQAQKAGLTPQAFLVGIVHDFLRGYLTRA